MLIWILCVTLLIEGIILIIAKIYSFIYERTGEKYVLTVIDGERVKIPEKRYKEIKEQQKNN